jgi:DNA-binding response OmpR family regulator
MPDAGAPAPRVLIVWGEQWPRALLRAALRDAGYDAVGATSLTGAMRTPSTAPGRGPVRLVVVEQDALGHNGLAQLEQLLARHGRPGVVLLAHAVRTLPPGAWERVLRRPFTVDDVASAIRELLPLPPGEYQPPED